jgi:4a-hydroxytetrahydrobiopterin dehydratase
MTQLAGRRCKPCEGSTPRLSVAEAQALLRDTPGWRLDEPGGTISKVYPFRNYYETLAFANAVAFIAHRENHHPVMIVGYRRCEVRYTTHAISGLSENDFICAAKVDQLFGAPRARADRSSPVGRRPDRSRSSRPGRSAGILTAPLANNHEAAFFSLWSRHGLGGNPRERGARLSLFPKRAS